MSEKPIDWRGSSLRDIKDDDIFHLMVARRPDTNTVGFRQNLNPMTGSRSMWLARERKKSASISTMVGSA